MKLPNGYGSVYKLPGNRRKPWAVRITVSRKEGKDGTTHWKYKYLGYYESQQLALNALAHFNENPYDMDANKTTFADVFEKWSAEHFPKISQSNIHGYNASYKLCEPLYNMKFVDLRKSHLQNIVDTCGKNYPTLRKLRVLFNVMYKFAMENDLCSKDYSQYIDIRQYKDRNPNKYDRKPFTKQEIEVLWNTVESDEYLQFPLILAYTGLRIGEFWNLKPEDVHLEKRWFYVRESKTDAGIREVPIAEKIVPFFEHWLNKRNEYVFTNRQGRKFLDRNFRDSYWKPMMELLNMEHKPHDTRHTCVSLLTEAGVDERIIKKIVGHKGKGVTETVYTHLDLEIKLEAINKI